MITVVLGTQWGDEGKGKLVDLLSQDVKICARGAGGHNAGHSVVANGVTYDFPNGCADLIPSGVLQPSCVGLIGSGSVFFVPQFFKELQALKEKGLEVSHDRLLVSDRCHIIFDLHQKVDGLEEQELGKQSIGTTKRGIGPTYSTMAARSGITISMMYNIPVFEQRLRTLAQGFKKRYGDLLDYDVEEEIARFKQYREDLAPYVIDAVDFMANAQKKGYPILVEGAQALLLDINMGNYPYVTSSSCAIGGAIAGLALNPRKIDRIIGVAKAYTTRVGQGPYPSEQDNEVGVLLQKEGHEWGVSTGRKRRTGYLDLVALRYSASVNWYTSICITKMDVLDKFPSIKVAVAYKHPDTGEKFETFPADADLLARVEVVYADLPGWKTPLAGATSWDQLPSEAQAYIKYIEDFVEVPVEWIGTGKDRKDIIHRTR